MTLKTILKNFLNYADTLDAQKKLGNDLYEVDFQKLKALTEELKHDKDYATSEGLKDVNRRKNRYKDILPYDYTRVILSEYPGVPGSDYINANYIKGASGSLAYIASQGPLPNTVVDFWRMIWECEIQVIVMACNEQESGKYKCECYWPTDEEKKQYGNINVEFVKWRQVCPDFLVRTLKACWETEERVICQFHYTTWPDHGVPNSVQPILELVRLIRDCQASEAVPVLVHCSAGCGRTGTICAIDFVWGLMRMGKLSKNFNLFNVIADMRRQRIAMVQTKEQYVLVHKAVSSLFEQQLRVIDNHTYENLDEDGEPLILKELQIEDDIYEDIMEPLMGENNFFDVKHDERILQMSRAFHESIRGNSDSSLLKKDTLRNLNTSFVKQNLAQLENDKLNENSKNCDEIDLSYSKNSRTLQRLCREESVKRLISGWNKAVEQSESVKAICVEGQNEFQTSKSPLSKNYSDNSVFETKSTSSPVVSSDLASTLKSESDVKKQASSTLKDTDSGDSSPKTSSPEDMHGGKLVGKATVIRRPSIAKLKALFEKSTQPHLDSDSNRQRRPLFRSHSHYVSNSSRTFSLSDNAEQPCSLSPSGNPSTHNKSDSAVRHDNYVHRFDNSNCNYLNSNESAYNLEKCVNNINLDSNQLTEDNRQKVTARHSALYYNNEEIVINDCPVHDKATESASLESYLNSNKCAYANYKEQVTDHDSTCHKKEKPPELPTKKKLAATVVSTSTSSKKQSENIVPRFQVNLPRDNQNFVDIKSNTSQTDASKIISSDYSQKGSSTIKSPNIQDWNNEEICKEYRRHSQEVDRKVLHKNQSFSDPEHSRPNEISKQVVKQKLNYADQTFPKLSYAHGKTASDDKLSHAYETTYMNVNPVAQKNIRQIEDSIKNHPRGAIIDLTSRKSYIDDISYNSDKQYVFKNISQPVKVLQPQESKDLIPREKSNVARTENASAAPTVKTSTQTNTKPIEKTDASSKDSDLINAKNLLLHSPPPKSKRSHSKTGSKSPVSPSANEASTVEIQSNTNVNANAHDETEKQCTPKTTQSAEASVMKCANISNTSASFAPAADRSDPRYFPVTRQTASEAKAHNRDAYSTPYKSTGIYETLYSIKQQPPFQKPALYEKEGIKCSTQESTKSRTENESVYGLQRSTSGPQMAPPPVPDSGSKLQTADTNKSQSVYSYVGGENSNKSKSGGSKDYRHPPPYDQSRVYKPVSSLNQQNSYPLGPPKPPRTFHYDVKSNHEKIPSSETYESQSNVKKDSGRYIVTVASPKHSNLYSVPPPRNVPNQEHRYVPDPRVPEPKHHNITSSNSQIPDYTPPPPMTNEVHMSHSYPLTHYDYSHPRPYGKHFYPESMTYRNVQPVSHVNNSIYGTVKEKQPTHHRENLYGTVKHRNPNYENVYDSHSDYVHAKLNSNVRTDHHGQSIPTNSMTGMQYSQTDANTYSAVPSQKSQTHLVKSIYNPAKPEYQNLDDSLGLTSKRVYFDTLQRRHKQHVSWEQRRSHDDMDIRTAPSARLREQIHARRSMVELDNLEISVASDDGYPEKNEKDPSLHSVHNKSSSTRNDRQSETQVKSINSDSSKESHHKKHLTHNKEGSFGETLSKAFGRLTSLTKFSGKEAQSNNTSINESSSNGSKAVYKQKEKCHDFSLQSPSSKENPPSEQWTQV